MHHMVLWVLMDFEHYYISTIFYEAAVIISIISQQPDIAHTYNNFLNTALSK